MLGLGFVQVRQSHTGRVSGTDHGVRVQGGRARAIHDAAGHRRALRVPVRQLEQSPARGALR